MLLMVIGSGGKCNMERKGTLHGDSRYTCANDLFPIYNWYCSLAKCLRLVLKSISYFVMDITVDNQGIGRKYDRV